MKQVYKVKVYKENDRQTVAAILVANGYIVWLGKEAKGASKRSYDYFIYYKEPDENGGTQDAV